MAIQARVHSPSNRQLKKALRRQEIALAAEGLANSTENLKATLAGVAGDALIDDDVVRSTKVYNAIKVEVERAGGRPFSADYKLADPPCRFKEDQLEPFLLRVARRLDAGSPRVEFKTRGDFASPSHSTWRGFVEAMLAGDIRTLLANITRLSRIVS